MTDFMYANKGGGGIFRKGQLGPIGQGTVGIDLVIDIFDLAQAPIDLTGYTTITGRMKKQDTGAVTAIDGTRTLVGTGSTGKFTWVVSANDSGTDGLFDVVFNLSNGTDTIVTLPGELLITNNPSVTASANNLLIGILQATSDWLDDEKTAVEGADTGEILESDGTNSRGTNYLTATSLRKNNYTAVTAPTVNDDTGDGYAPGSYWVDTVGLAVYFCQVATLGGAVWEDVTAATVVAWGAITGTLADQTDLQTALNAKAAASNLSTHEALTTSAHGGLIPQDALIISKTEGYQVASGDAGKIIECSGTFSVTFPNGLDTGFQVTVVNVGAGVITLAASTTLQSDGTQLETQYTGASVYHRGSNVWLALGRLT